MPNVRKKFFALLTACAMGLSTVSYAAAPDPASAHLALDGLVDSANSAARMISGGDVSTHEVVPDNSGGAYGLNGVVETETGQSGVNLALGAVAASSGNETADFSQDKANDGDSSTRWSSAPVSEDTPQWLSLDFGAPTTFNNVKLVWERSAGAAYQVQISDDGQSWSDIAAITDGVPGQTRILGFQPVTARYVRVFVTENFPDIWTCVSLFEVEVYLRDWDFIRTQAQEQLDRANAWSQISGDVALPLTTPYGATVTWRTDSELLEVADGTLHVTMPETTTAATLTATITYGEQSAEYPISLRLLSQQDLDNSYAFSPVPQSMTMTYALIDFDQVKVFYEPGITDVTRARVEEVLTRQGVSFSVTDSYDQSTLAIGLHGSGEAVDTHTTGYSQELFTPSETKYDAHYLDINENGRVTILGEDDDGAYYALATLEDAMDTVAGQQLACAVIEDYANMQYRGIVEGFYGKVYSVEDILSLFDYMEENKMNTFVYGPKGDPYHLGNWRDDYPTEITEEERFYGQMTQDDMRTIAAAAAENNISFVWSVHPAMQNGIDFTDRQSVEAGIDAIMTKFEHMYQLGIRQFGVFVDDIDLNLALQGSENQAYMMAELQRRLEAEYNSAADPADHVAGTFYVPSFYALGFGSDAQLQQNLGAFKEQNQDNEVIMMMTGTGVWSSVTNDSLQRIREYTGKKPVLWWNYPVNDNIDDQMLMDRLNAVYATDLDVVDGMGILSNPMNQAEASKVSLYGLADYTWNIANFDVNANWARSFASYTDDPALQDALRLFASHASKEQDFTGIDQRFAAYRSDPTQYQAVVDEMQRLVDACQLLLTLEDSGDYKLVNLLDEIRPWVYRLNDMSQIIIHALQAIHGEEEQRFDHLMEAVYLYNGIDSLDKYKVESLEGQGVTQTISNYITAPGAKYILPFAREMVEQASGSFFDASPAPVVYTDTQVEGWPMALSDHTYTVPDGERVTLNAGAYVQFDLAQLVTLSQVAGLDQLEPQISLDGKSWTGYSAGAQARYVRVVNHTADPVEVDLSQVSLAAQVVSISSITSSAEMWEPGNYPTGNISDYNPTTFLWLNSQAQGTSLTVTYGGLTPVDRIEFGTTTDGDRLVGQVTFACQTADGSWVDVGTVDSDTFVDGATALSFDPIQAKAIRATVTQSRSGNWLKVTEFHGVSTQGKAQVMVNGVGESKLTDRNVMSGIQPTGTGEVIYHVYQSVKATDLVLYNALGAWDGVSVYAVTAQGETLLDHDAQQSSDGARVYHAHHLKGVTAFRIAYTDGLYLNEIDLKGERFVALNLYGVQPQVDAAKAAAAEEGYTPDSIAALTGSIAAVEALLADHTLGEPVTRQALTAALDAMNAAVDARVPQQSADKTQLQKAYDDARGLDTTGADASAVAAFRKAMDQAKAVLDDPEATQAEVDAAVNQLNAAIGGLTGQGEPQPSGQPTTSQTPDVQEVAPTGDSASRTLPLAVTFFTAAAGALILVERKRRSR